MSRVCKPGGKLLVFAWALEQPPTSSLHRHPLQYVEAGNEQDVLVPWTDKATDIVHHRYYHLFRQGELDSLAGEGLEIVECGYDKDNWYVIFTKEP
jgi:tRNA (uracil-5-)-methyltransferase TRM9